MATTRKPKVTNEVIVKVKRLDERACLPERKTEGAACFDVRTLDDIYLKTINAYEKATIVHTGLAFDIPEGYHMKVFLRSSVGLNTHLRLANQTAIIDSDYRGELKLLVENPAREPVNIKAGVRIAQVMIEKNIPTSFSEVKELGETPRGEGGLGSTGKE